MKCPDLPVWLEQAEMHVHEMNESLIPVHLLELLSHYRRAKNNNYESAEPLAERYESGD